ncbi:MAG: ABC transporter ATP-binding protein [Desulfarculaceae bacterium]|nr:ABC transporter ATP-binding protein [Desulfarculaceae bacterium]MCF8048913.1 ABC transporter ATP-binding protein [Desulfarculaceae bacterium]MCF8064468.1 ABC transporter ATP-binding protein [Desulfarculaceae bacterium]MCF8099494.1 ABC transporter ATP-binding protein [Desulfarculaceae bacterium]MCF8123102.1 ABC transporter ATP-binding protein [Desulfarculaceae bacterium]
MGALLSIKGLSVRFGGLQALDSVDLEAPAGAITALIGPNGAGKTTAINCVSGVVAPDSGQVSFDGREVLGMAGHNLARLGLTRTFQNLQVFGLMNALENVMVGMHAASHGSFAAAMLRLPVLRRQEAAIRERAEEMLAFFGLEKVANQPAEELAYGDQKRLELARALAGRPRLMLLDEPVAGLNAAETHEIGGLIVKIKEQGIGVVLVEHDMGLVMHVSDQVAVLSGGVLIAQGTPEEIQQDPEVLRTYLGGGEEFGLLA